MLSVSREAVKSAPSKRNPYGRQNFGYLESNRRWLYQRRIIKRLDQPMQWGDRRVATPRAVGEKSASLYDTRTTFCGLVGALNKMCERKSCMLRRCFQKIPKV